MKKRPIIGVTGPDKGGAVSWFFIKYALLFNGGKAKRITPKRAMKIDKTKLNGLIISGGSDISPDRYESNDFEELKKEAPKKSNHEKKRWLHYFVSVFVFILRKIFSIKKMTRLDQRRDEIEFEYLQYAVDNKLPVLGICRGSQIINIFFKGTLHRDITDFYTEEPMVNSIFPKKEITLSKGCKLFNIIQRDRTKVNSLHHQSIDKVGDDLCVCAKEDNGIIQGIEHEEFNFLIGVQWHPEYLPQKRTQRKIFKKLIETASDQDSKAAV